MCAEEFTYLRAKSGHPSKVTILSAQQAAAYYDNEKSKAAYPTIKSYLADIVDILKGEVQELIDLRCTYIQVDAPQYAALLDPQIREGYRKRGSDPDKLLDRCIELDNAVIGNHSGTAFGLHICRGNNQSKFYASGDYGAIAAVFSRTRFRRFLLEFDDARSGGFEPLRHVPNDRTVVLGLVTTKKPQLETKKLLKQRIKEASNIVPVERLAISPQCGFASTLEGNLLTFAQQEAKLKLIGDTAREVWGSSGATSGRKVFPSDGFLNRTQI
jgi:5-methyltetrahydropteroyltriglutamate--homocysteine methyltransferase